MGDRLGIRGAVDFLLANSHYCNSFIRVRVAIPERIGLKMKLMRSLESHPDTDIFSKRRKIYSICVDDRDDTVTEEFLCSYLTVVQPGLPIRRDI